MNLDFYVNEFERTGFRGGLNWYRNDDRNWELLSPYADAKVTVPALYIAGDRDGVVYFQGMDRVIANLANDVRRDPERPNECGAAVSGGLDIDKDGAERRRFRLGAPL